jgi:hypothetical protein
MFDSIAPTYDRMNTLMTAGQDGRWRGPPSGPRVSTGREWRWTWPAARAS